MKALGFVLRNVNVCLNWTLSFSVSLQVDIVPSQGEISVGESKFFLCQGKCPGPTALQGILPADQQPWVVCWLLAPHPEFLVSLCCRVNSVTWEPRRLSGPLPPLSKGSPSTGNCIWTCTWWWSTGDVPGRVSTTPRRVSQLRAPTLNASRAHN